MSHRLTSVFLLEIGAAVVLLATGLVGVRSSTAAPPAAPSWVLRGAYSPSVRPSNFVAKIDNRFFPLVPGTTFHYRGHSGDTPQTDDMEVTLRTKTIFGIRCTVVRDTVSERGNPVERTFDWYAQDKQGNVWYMGEYSLELRHGRFVRASDSWQSGIKGAKPGIIMRGNPHPGDVYRQEFYPPGGALDQARVLGSEAARTVPYGTFKRVLDTVEWSPVEPQLERKYYVTGVGEIEEQVVHGGHERFLLVAVTH